MKIGERYSTARNTSNLKSAPRTTFSASDVLGAAGMAGQEQEVAMMLWEVAFKSKTKSKMALVERLTSQLTVFMLRAGMKGDPRKITMEVVAWWLYGTCMPCGGLGYEKAPGTPSLTDRLCKACRGHKKVKLPRTEPHDWLHDRMSRLQAIAGGRVMRKIADDLSDFS